MMRTLSKVEAAAMVERLLRGERAETIARDFGVDPTLPPLKAFKWGFIGQRLRHVLQSDLTQAGRRWLASRPAPAR